MKARNRMPGSVWGALGAALIVAWLVGGCASQPSYTTVPASATGTSQSITAGTVVATKTVVVDGQSTNLGRIAGGSVGAGVGSAVGSGDGRIIGSAAGAVVGMVLGDRVEKELSKKVAQELTIDLDDGHVIVVVQERRGPGFLEGDRVEVLETRTGDARVRHAEFPSDGLYWAAGVVEG